MTDNQDVGSYENSKNDSSMPSVGSAQPAHQGSQSYSPSKQGVSDYEAAKKKGMESYKSPSTSSSSKGTFGWGGLTN